MPSRCRILSDKFRFDCTLSGPFDDLTFTRLSAPRALCGSRVTFISASTVYRVSIAQNPLSVKGNRQDFLKILRMEILGNYFCAGRIIFGAFMLDSPQTAGYNYGRIPHGTRTESRILLCGAETGCREMAHITYVSAASHGKGEPLWQTSA